MSVILASLVAAMFLPLQAEPPKPPPINWREEEKGILDNQTQLTFADRFVKAGESYFSPDGRRIVFQGVEKPPEGKEPDDKYAMFVADLVSGPPVPPRGGAQPAPTGAAKWHLENIRRISPPGSSNTCGWFHPTDPNKLLFASTITKPTESAPPGYQRGTNKYRWSFPPEMRIVEVDLRKADGTPESLTVIAGDGKAYVAEGSYSADGQRLLYCSLASGKGDILTRDLRSGAVTPLVTTPGYDGGPFFSPDGKRICYRSDRHDNSLLQVKVADLDIGPDGSIRGVTREHAVTANNDVNWCPFWHPAGKQLLYATSAMGHRNYEVFIADAISDETSTPPQDRYGTNVRRVTHADGADVLPCFDPTGKLMLWTSQRDAEHSSQLWIADFVMPLEPPPPAEPSGH